MAICQAASVRKALWQSTFNFSFHSWDATATWDQLSLPQDETNWFHKNSCRQETTTHVMQRDLHIAKAHIEAMLSLDEKNVQVKLNGQRHEHPDQRLGRNWWRVVPSSLLNLLMKLCILLQNMAWVYDGLWWFMVDGGYKWPLNNPLKYFPRKDRMSRAEMGHSQSCRTADCKTSCRTLQKLSPVHSGNKDGEIWRRTDFPDTWKIIIHPLHLWYFDRSFNFDNPGFKEKAFTIFQPSVKSKCLIGQSHRETNFVTGCMRHGPKVGPKDHAERIRPAERSAKQPLQFSFGLGLIPSYKCFYLHILLQ